ncbi:MAG: serine/threonine-protein kinase [Pyrinomonadaceae bacterium]
MNPDKWVQISSLFQLAAECEPERRAELLESKCSGDDALRREVEELLRSHEAGENFLANSPLEIPALLLNYDLSNSLEGKHIGAYKILREIGRGGMGVVCLAIRDDDEFRKRVALKLVKRGMDSDEILNRFRNERQILASLDHPNIARILDGGTTDDGLPYFVMEYIEGESIGDYCDTRKLPTVERLKIFRKVCAAVSYAHQNLVVHRDLKPSNIVITPDGEPKLLDFGIAKLLKPDLFPQIVQATGILTRPMTLDYASPEQVRGLPITTTSDVYSLGVLLYELLTGHRPYHLKNQTVAEIERVICEEEPERPSAIVRRKEVVTKFNGEESTISPESISRTREGHPRKLQQKLRGDLDKILLKALRKEPNRRYDSVEQFSEDIRRYLIDLPVLAHKDSFRYRSRKFLWRHKFSLTIGAFFIILIVGFAAAFRSQAIRAEQQRLRAEKVSAFLAEIFKVSDPNEAKGNTITAREILDKGAARVEQEMSDQPEVQAMLLETIGGVYDSLALYDNAQRLLEKSLQIRREVFGDMSEETAGALYHLSLVFQHKAEFKAAETTLEEALRIRQNLYGNESERTMETLTALGSIAYQREDYPAAENFFRRSLEIARRIFGKEHPSIPVKISNLANAVADKGDFDAAEPLYKEALDLSRKIFGSENENTARILDNFASFQNVSRENYDEAARLRQESLAIRRKLHGDLSRVVAFGLNNLAALLEKKKDYAAAESALRESLAIERKILGDDHPGTAFRCRELGHFLFM